MFEIPKFGFLPVKDGVQKKGTGKNEPNPRKEKAC
jgi:hypothetical protein